ncbi:MAG: hypothetical protein ACP5NI_07055 [Acetobacteraceae bacterium]
MSQLHVFNPALVREPAVGVARELRASDRSDPDFHRVRAQHAAYVAAMRAAGHAVTVLRGMFDTVLELRRRACPTAGMC